MFAQTKSERETAKRFGKKLKTTLKGMKLPHAAVRTVSAKAVPTPSGRQGLTLGQVVEIPERDIIHVFESETMLAVSHAIEDLAGETGCGELISTFQEFANFEYQRKRYLALARDLDAVRVWGSGPVPKRAPGIDFIACDDPKVKRYWIVLFESPETHAVLVCKQMNQATEYAKKKFVGYYSFNPYLVQSIRWRFNLMSSGLEKVINHFEKSLDLPQFKMRDLDQFLKCNGHSAAA